MQSPWLRALLLVTGGCGRTGFEDLPRDAAVASPAPEDALLDTPPACAGSTAQLDSPCLGTFSAKSVYFDVEATRTVTVTGLETLSQSCGTRDVSIYVRPGTHVGVETISSAWTLAGSSTGFTPACASSCPIAPTPLPIPLCVTIPAGQRYAFYVVMTAGTGTLETFDAPLGATVVQDTAVVLRAGRISLEIGAFTGALIDGKGWQGALRYAP